jgi:osmotically-inducible protein OsmY
LIEERIQTDERLHSEDVDVAVEVGNGVVLLTGAVPSREHRDRAVAIAKETVADQAANIAMDYMVRDRIDLVPAGASITRMTETVDTDHHLFSVLMAKLTVAENPSARKVRLDVLEGVVSLRGDVASPEAKEEAERLVAGTEGVREINNELRVVPSW